MEIVPCALHDNLMRAGAVSDGCLITGALASAERYAALCGFERCLELGASQLGR